METAERCDPKTNALRATLDLSIMVEKKLGVRVKPADLRAFVEANFDRLSMLAHAIHRGP
jgi:hypothetical protein